MSSEMQQLAAKEKIGSVQRKRKEVDAVRVVHFEKGFGALQPLPQRSMQRCVPCCEQGSGRVLSSWQVTRVQKNFGKRGVQQLQALENKPYLLSLSGEQQ